MSLGHDRCSLYTLFILGALCDCSLFLEIFEHIHFIYSLPHSYSPETPSQNKKICQRLKNWIEFNSTLYSTTRKEEKYWCWDKLALLLRECFIYGPFAFSKFPSKFPDCIYYVTSSVWPFLLWLSDKFSLVFM